MSMGQNKTVSRELWDARFLDLVLSLEHRLGQTGQDGSLHNIEIQREIRQLRRTIDTLNSRSGFE